MINRYTVRDDLDGHIADLGKLSRALGSAEWNSPSRGLVALKAVQRALVALGEASKAVKEDIDAGPSMEW